MVANGISSVGYQLPILVLLIILSLTVFILICCKHNNKRKRKKAGEEDKKRNFNAKLDSVIEEQPDLLDSTVIYF